MTKFEELVNCINGNHIYIQTHNFPDPDAIASAYGIQQLLKTKNIESTICYNGKIDRSSTNKMVKHLGIQIINMDDMSSINKINKVILVDAQNGNANIRDLTGIDIICVDHHNSYEKCNYLYSDIRPEVGACASIIAEYFYENYIEIDVKVATALMFAIKVDTANMTRGVSNLDLEMFYKLYKICDIDFIKSIEMGIIQISDLYAYANAINSIKVYDNISFANTGKECQEALIATISDFMLALDEVNISVVYSVKKDGIKLSVRSEKQYDAGLITKNALRGIGNGGGHEQMAGGFVPTQPGCDTNRLIADLEDRLVETVHELYGL